MTAVSIVVVAALWSLMVGSAAVWSLALTRRLRGLPLIPAVEQPRTPWPWLAVLVAGVWIALLTLVRVVKDVSGEQTLPDSSGLVYQLAMSLVIWISVISLLATHAATALANWGLTLERWPNQMAYGAAGYLASFLPTFVAMQLLSPWRSEETQHDFLRLLGESPDWRVLLLMLITVAVAAPLSEELLFRAVLQGWLRERCGPAWAIPLVAVLFAAIHGWRDGLALLPLALILGVIYERRRSYLAVVVAHGLFNSVMFGLAWLTAGVAEPGA